jgi:hypothetical protein
MGFSWARYRFQKAPSHHPTVIFKNAGVPFHHSVVISKTADVARSNSVVTSKTPTSQ